MTTPNVGDKATCQSCGDEIIYVGPYWDHIGPLKPRHNAEPAGPIYAGQTIPFTDISTRLFRFIAGQLTAQQLKDWFAPKFKTYPPSVQADIAKSIRHLVRVLDDPETRKTLIDLLPEERLMTWTYDDILGKLREFSRGEVTATQLHAWLAPKIPTLPQSHLPGVMAAIKNLAQTTDDPEAARALYSLLPALSFSPEEGTEGEPPEILSVSVSDHITPEERVG